MSTGRSGFSFGRYTVSLSVEIADTRLNSSSKPIHVGEMEVVESLLDRESGKTGNGTPRIAIAVMGEASTFSRWYHVLSEQETHSQQLSFIYGAYDDKQVSDENQQRCNEQVHFQTCHADFIPNTTWTQGRNILARHILKIEKQQDQEFDFWIFADDDLELVSSTPTAGKSQGELWQSVLEQLRQASGLSGHKLSQFTVTLAYHPEIPQGGWVGVSTYDANFAVFSRWAVPYLLPYAIPRPGDSEWISQAALFCVTQTCFPSSVGVLPDMISSNEIHREYPKDRFTPQAIGEAVQDNVGSYLDLNKFCTHEKSSVQYQDPIGKVSSVADLENALPPSPMSNGLCEPLAVRFHDWGRQTSFP
jgi:hypothetical protein